MLCITTLQNHKMITTFNMNSDWLLKNVVFCIDHLIFGKHKKMLLFVKNDWYKS